MKETIGIVGGGITGASVAYHLAKHSNKQVIVFEKDTIASQTTAKSAAFIGFHSHQTQVQRDLMKYGISLYNSFFADPKTALLFRYTGGLEVTDSEEGYTQMKSVYEQADPTGSTVEFFDREDLVEQLVLPTLDSESVRGALYWSNYGYIDPTEATFEFVERAENHGADFRVNTRVDDILGPNAVTGVETEQGRIEVDHLVVAAGPWTPELVELADVDLPIRHSLAPAMILEDDTLSRYPSISHLESGVYLRQHHNDRVFVGHYQGAYEQANPKKPPHSDDVPLEYATTMSDAVSTFVPYLDDANILEEWVGLRSLTPDTNPIIGPTEKEGLSVAVFNGSGVQHAPIAGKILSDQILGNEPTWYEDVSVSRFDGYSDSWTE